MYLYEANKDEIKVYGFWPKRLGQNVIYYKDTELDKIYPNNRVLKAETNMSFFPLNVDNIGDRIIFDEVNVKNDYLFKVKYHQVNPCNFNSVDVYTAIRDYHKRAAKTYNLVEVERDSELEYWLVPKEYYQIVYDTYVLKGIINIPEKLRDLYYFETGRFEKVSNSRLKEFRWLYQFRKTPIQTFDRDTIREMIMCGMIENKITDDILERDAETIQRLRKIYK